MVLSRDGNFCAPLLIVKDQLGVPFGTRHARMARIAIWVPANMDSIFYDRALLHLLGIFTRYLFT